MCSPTNGCSRRTTEALCECSPLCQSCLRACEVRDDPSIDHHDVSFEFKYGDDGGPEASAFVQTANADKLPPQLQCVASEAGGAQPRSKPVHGGMAGALTFTTLFPEAFGVIQPGQNHAIRFEEPENPEEELHNALADRHLTIQQQSRSYTRCSTCSGALAVPLCALPLPLATSACNSHTPLCDAACLQCTSMLCSRLSSQSRSLACRYNIARVLQEFILHKWAEAEHKQTSSRQLQRSSTAAPTKTRTCRAPCTMTPLRRHRAKMPTASVDTDDGGDIDNSNDSGRAGAHAAPGDEFAQFFRRSTCAGHTCSSGAHAAFRPWISAFLL